MTPPRFGRDRSARRATRIHCSVRGWRRTDEHGILSLPEGRMRKKLTRTGNSLALVLDKPLLDRLGIDADTPLDVSTDGQVLVISPAPDKRRTAKLKAI